MESDRAVIAALIFILLIILSNFVMYAIARGATRGRGSNWISTLRDSLNKPRQGSSDSSMDELRKRVEELKKNRREKQ